MGVSAVDVLGRGEESGCLYVEADCMIISFSENNSSSWIASHVEGWSRRLEMFQSRSWWVGEGIGLLDIVWVG